jgi:hypothetical protein
MQQPLLLLTVASLALCVGCNRESEFITETSPFFEVAVPTPADGKAAIAQRAERFAAKHRMKVHFVPDHFEPHEFTVSVTRNDLNIIVGNVMRGDQSAVSAFARSQATAAQRREVDTYLCEVMRHGCAR